MTGSSGTLAAILDSAAGSITWTVDQTGPTKGLVSAIRILVPVALRGAWLAIGPNGLPGMVTVFFDIKRTAAGSTAIGRFGNGTRPSILVYPGTDSPAVLASGGGFQPVLTAAPASGGAVLSPLQLGLQGPVDTAYADQQVALLRAQLAAANLL